MNIVPGPYNLEATGNPPYELSEHVLAEISDAIQTALSAGETDVWMTGAYGHDIYTDLDPEHPDQAVTQLTSALTEQANWWN